MRIGAVWAERIGGAAISAVMSGVMSAVMINLNAGLGADFPLALAQGLADRLLRQLPYRTPHRAAGRALAACAVESRIGQMHVFIDDQGKGFLLINTFTVEPDRQTSLIDALRRLTDGFTRIQPGFVAACVHAALDGRRLVNYVQ